MKSRKSFILELLCLTLYLLHVAESSQSQDNARRRRQQQQQQQESETSTNITSIYANSFVVQCTSTPTLICKEDKVICQDKVEEQQRNVIAAVKEMIPGTEILQTAQKIMNCIFIRPPNDYNSSLSILKTIEGVKRITNHETYHIEKRSSDIVLDSIPTEDATALHVGAQRARDEYCATGRNVVVAVLDTGIDYTHSFFGGAGTKKVYRDAIDNRDKHFPTDVVIDGTDSISRDDDPIDHFNGHGTAVASNIRTIAPDAKFLAVRVCDREICPQAAIIGGIEYAVEKKADFINLSLGTVYDSAYNDLVSLALENAFLAGVLSIVSTGNQANKPYTIATTAESPNSLAVAATGEAGDLYQNRGSVEFYSSRGPGANNAIKPDIAAPTGTLAAVSGSGTKGSRDWFGTSFSCPVVAGAAALLKERCPSCSPFAIKTLLMNNAFRNVTYSKNGVTNAPVTRIGSGELRVDKAIQADFWAYSETDVQPTVSLGLVDANKDKVFRRKIKIHSLSDTEEVLEISSSFRDPADKASGALYIYFDKDTVTLGGCNKEAVVEATFLIYSRNAPSNNIGYGGIKDSASDGFLLDKNELDGHIMITSKRSRKDISLPFHVLLRKAADTSVSTTTLPWIPNQQSSTTVRVQNDGKGVAQLDAYSLIYLGEDEAEANRGDPPNEDLRSIGFRSREVDLPNCKSSLLEFAINTWERHDYLLPSNIIINLDVDASKPYDQYRIEFDQLLNYVRIVEYESADVTCAGFPPDDATNTANTIIRVCADDVGNPGIFNASFSVYRYPEQEPDPVVVYGIQTTFSAHSHDIGPMKSLNNFEILGTGVSVGEQLDEPPLGLQLITNAYRGGESTGAATRETETLLLLVDGTKSFSEKTPDDGYLFPLAEVKDGPECLWRENACANTPAPVIPPTTEPTISPEPTTAPTAFPPINPGPPTCGKDAPVPRPQVPTASPTGGCQRYGEECNENSDCCFGTCKSSYTRMSTCDFPNFRQKTKLFSLFDEEAWDKPPYETELTPGLRAGLRGTP